MLGLLALQPALALAHGGEEMTPEEMAAAEKAAEMGHDPSQHEGMSGMASHDPLLGGTELTLILLVAVGFVAWAGYALRGRVAASSSRATRRERPRTAIARQPARAHTPVPAMPATQSGLEGSYVTQASEPATEPTAAVPQNGHRPRTVPRSRVSPA
jgi:hypothetical protein